MSKRWIAASAWLLMALSTPLWAQQPPITVGVLSFRPKPAAEAQWQPLTDYLEKTVKGVRFKLQVYNYAELKEAIRQQHVDLVITQPGEYVRMVHQNGLSSPLATLINLEGGKPIRAFGGAILTRSNRADLNSLKDLAGKRIAIPANQSFGGYQVQAYELALQQISPASFHVTGMPHDRAMEALLAGEVDAAFVRTGLLEAMAGEGKLDVGQVKVLNPQNYPGYPFALSTRLYPEWPVVAMSHVPSDLAARIAGALLLLPHGGEITQSMGIYGFATPSDYESVRALMRELRVPPFDTPAKVTLQDIWTEYKLQILAALLTLGALLALAAREVFLRQRIASFGNAMGEGMYVLDRQGRARYVNRAACELLGYPREALLGRKLLDVVVSPVSMPQHFKGMNPLTDPARRKQPFEGENVFVNAQGKSFPVEVSSQPVLRKGKFVRSVTVFSDISERKAQSERVYQLAYYDTLTALPNRRLLLDKLQQQLDASASSQQPGALLFSDLDRFKQLNDTLGHKLGDALLQAVARRFRTTVGDVGTVAHTGGDEFAVLLSRLDNPPEQAAEQARVMAEKIRLAMNDPFEIEGQHHKISVSIGVVMVETHDHDGSAEEMLKRADIAMYQAKASGRNTIRFFDQVIEQQLSRQVALESDLHQALREHQFEVFYQPQVDAQGRMVGVETLVRWQHPQRGMILPGEFIALAEENGLILQLGQWVMEQACQQIVEWSRNPATSGLIVAVNLSALQILQSDFVSRVAHNLKASGANPARLQLELTESVLATNIDEVIDKMRQLVAMGVTFSLDDFGTGYSSLNYLKRLPLHQLKIDSSFVHDLMTDSNDVAITQTILALGRSLDLEVIAEGVENQDQRDVLTRQGCPLFQGYLFGRPQPPAALAKLLNATPSLQTGTRL